MVLPKGELHHLFQHWDATFGSIWKPALYFISIREQLTEFIKQNIDLVIGGPAIAMAGRGIFPAMVDKMSGAPGYFYNNRAHFF